MRKIIEITVPDIGDFNNVPVIEVLVRPGDRVEKDASLVTLESDKSTMEIPSSHAGTVKSIKLKVGDKVAMGSEILTLEVDEAAPAVVPLETPAPAPAPDQSFAAPAAG